MAKCVMCGEQDATHQSRLGSTVCGKHCNSACDRHERAPEHDSGFADVEPWDITHDEAHNEPVMRGNYEHII